MSGKKQIIILAGIALFFIYIFHELLTIPKTYATTYLSGTDTTDSCNKVDFTLSESPSCPNISSPQTQNVASYSITLHAKSKNGNNHTIDYTYKNSFCTTAYLNNGCLDNTIQNSGSFSTGTGAGKDFTINRSPTTGSNCGNYQLDLKVTAIDGNTSCNYPQNSAWSLSGQCETGRACTAATYAISGKVFIDTNQNGTKDTGESGYSGGTTVKVKQNGNVVGTDTTDSNGNYSIGSLATATYTVSFTLPNGYSETTNSPFTKTISNSDITGVNFGIIQLPDCTNGATGCGACNAPNNTCSNNNGTQTCTHDHLSGGSTNCNPVTFSQACTINNCGSNSCSGGVCVAPTYTISGNIFVDYNNNGSRDAQDTNFATQTVTVTAVRTSDGLTLTDATTDASGNFSIPNAPNGTYTVTLSVPANYKASTATSQTVTVNNANITTPNGYGITPLLSITGVLFNDADGDGFYTGADSKYTGSSTVTITGPVNLTLNNITTGTYTTNTQLTAGNYTVSYTSLPAGYFMTYPQNGPPPSFAITVGVPGKTPACATNGYNSASCDGSGNISNLNFGISNVKPWYQTYCGDMRLDNGFDNPLPASPVCGGTALTSNAITPNTTCNTNPGVFFSGNSPSTFGSGQVSTNKWLAGGNNINPEKFSPVNMSVIRTSYNYMLTTAKQSGITPVDITTVAGCSSLANCTLPGTLPHGLYQANGALTLNAFTVPSSTPQSYVILVNGDVTVKGAITIAPNSGSTFTISSAGNITVDSSVGQSSVSDTTGTLNGFFSADKSFIIQAVAGSCSTGVVNKRLNIQGAIVTNAALQGGSFQNNRDLCAQNLHCPVVTFSQRPDLILNAPSFVKHAGSIFQEIAP